MINQKCLKLIYVVTLQPNTDLMIIAQLHIATTDDVEFCTRLFYEFVTGI